MKNRGAVGICFLGVGTVAALCSLSQGDVVRIELWCVVISDELTSSLQTIYSYMMVLYKLFHYLFYTLY